MSVMARTHLVMGFIFLGVFLLTGVYMDNNFPGIYGDNEGTRIMFRASHIYILMAALINIVTGVHGAVVAGRVFRFLHLLASVLIILAPILFLVGFITEPAIYDTERTYSFWGVLFLLVGVVLQALISLFSVKQK